MTNEILSKDEHLRKQWLNEQERISDQKRNLSRYLNDLQSTCVNLRKKSCANCFHSISMLYSAQLLGIYDKTQRTREEYRRTLLPLQYLSAFLCLMNNAWILFIFEKCAKLYIPSNILLLLCLWIHAEFFLPYRPSVAYTLFIAWSIMLFTTYLLLKLFSTLVIIDHYHLMDPFRNNDQEFELHEKHFLIDR